MPRKPVTIATRAFDSQGDAKAFFKEMLNRYKPDECVGEEDALHLAALLERHSEYQEKVGIGLDCFEVMMSEHGTQCFRIVRRDPSPFSHDWGMVVGEDARHRRQVAHISVDHRNSAMIATWL